jgi:hypothetical protein
MWFIKRHELRPSVILSSSFRHPFVNLPPYGSCDQDMWTANMFDMFASRRHYIIHFYIV